MNEPAPIAVPAGRSDEEIVRAIKFSLATKGWAIEQEQPGRIVASHRPRSHVARVTVTTAAGQVAIQYLDSTNLRFEEKDGKRTIHPAYNDWVLALRSEMERNVVQGVAADAAIPIVAAGGQIANPKPVEKFSNFGRFELVEATYAGESAKPSAKPSEKAGAKPSGVYARRQAQQGSRQDAKQQGGSDDDAVKNIRHNLNLNLAPLVEHWNTKAAAPGTRLLRIEPSVEYVRFVGTGARIFAGRMAGRSSVIVKVRYVDGATGNTVAHPEFYLVAEAANGLSVSRNDYKMLEDIGVAVAEYTQANYADAVGGGTPAPADFKRK